MVNNSYHRLTDGMLDWMNIGHEDYSLLECHSTVHSGITLIRTEDGVDGPQFVKGNQLLATTVTPLSYFGVTLTLCYPLIALTLFVQPNHLFLSTRLILDLVPI